MRRSIIDMTEPGSASVLVAGLAAFQSRSIVHALATALALVMFLPIPAHAVPIEIDLTISFLPSPPPIIPNGATYTGIAQFSFSNILTPTPPPIDIGAVAIGQTFFTAFSPMPPPIDQDIGIAFGNLFFSFGGSVLMPNPPPIFPLAAFLDDADLPNALPMPPPILPIGFLAAAPTPPPIHASGNIVAFDDPVIVGTFDITVHAVPEPGSFALILGPVLLSLVGIVWRRRVNCDPCS